MYLPLGTFSPDVKIALVSASRSCFPRELSERRTEKLVAASKDLGLDLFLPEGRCCVIETKDHAREAAAQMFAAGCDAAVLFLGNFSPEIEDAFFVKQFPKPVMVIAAKEESAKTLCDDRGDALCGMLSAMLGMGKRSFLDRVHIPEAPLVDAEEGAAAIAHFLAVMRVVKGVRNATVGLFGPRPRDFDTCNYNLASCGSIGVEVEEFGFFDLVHEVERVKASQDIAAIIAEMNRELPGIPAGEFGERLASYEKAVLNLRERLKLSGMASQCWTEQEETLKHVPCFINGRMAKRGFPVACENDCYSLIAELMGQYATSDCVTILDLNHSIPADLGKALAGLPLEDVVGLFHCGNTAVSRLKNPEMKYQLIMKRIMEPDTAPDITRGTVEGQIAASPITVIQVHGTGDRMNAYIAEGEFLDLDPQTFGCTGTAYIPGFRRFYRHVLLGRFHHHAAVAFGHCGAVLYDALKLIGVENIFTPLPEHLPYPGENVFKAGFVPKRAR